MTEKRLLLNNSIIEFYYEKLAVSVLGYVLKIRKAYRIAEKALKRKKNHWVDNF